MFTVDELIERSDALKDRVKVEKIARADKSRAAKLASKLMTAFDKRSGDYPGSIVDEAVQLWRDISSVSDQAFAEGRWDELAGIRKYWRNELRLTLALSRDFAAPWQFQDYDPRHQTTP